MSRYALHATLLVLSATALPACGGGGGGGGTADTLRGVLAAPLVAGLPYETPSHQGLTDVDGGFLYEAGELVTFRFGDTQLSQVPGAAALTSVDLVPGTTLPTTKAQAKAFLDPDWREARRNDQFINLVVLFHTIDEDADPNNGIQVPALFASSDNNLMLDMSIPYYQFRDDLQFRALLADGVSEGLWGGLGKGVVSLKRALQHLYEDLNIQTTFCRVTNSTRDADGDGTVDRTDEYQYDSSGRRTFSRRDNDGDGVIDVQYHQTYNSLDQRIELTADFNLDGIDRRERWQYDSNGRELEFARDEGDDGSLDYLEVSSRNAIGLKTMFERDSGADGVWDQRVLYLYDGAGRLILQDTDYEPDGTIDSRWAIEYDAQGRPVYYRDDSGADGTWDEVDHYVYDSAGRIHQYRSDSDGDGIWDEFTGYEFDALGRYVGSTTDEFDDGSIDQASGIVYDANGWIQSTWTDDDADGTVDSETVYEYNANGDVTLRSFDGNADGVPDATTRYFYDANGFRIRMERDSDADGTLDIVEEYVPESGTWFDV